MVKHSPILRYGGAVIALILATAVRAALDPLLGDSASFTTYYFAIMFAVWYGGLGPGLTALAVGGVAGDYFFVTPRWTLLFENHTAREHLGVGLFYAVGLGIIMLNEIIRRRKVFAEIVIDGIPGLFYVLDRHGRFVQWNPRVEQLTGLTAETLRGMDALLTIAEEDREFMGRKMQEVFEKGQAEAEARFLAKDCIRDFLFTGRRLDVGTTSYLVGSGVDITDRKRVESELQTAKTAAELANHAKDHFLAVLSHELRTPLTPVVLGVSMLKDRPDLDPKIHEMLEMVGRNVEMEARLIDDLLDVSRIARGKIELNRSVVELSTVIQSAVEVCRPDIEARRLHFGVDMGPDAPYWIVADEYRLQQVFWNLLKNAIKFTPRGGCVGFRCRLESAQVMIEVNDSGIGIQEESLPRIFDPFEQAESSITRQFGGLGLGLTICKALVEMHGGTIEAKSEGREKGATFRVRLPLAAPTVLPRASLPVQSRVQRVRSLHILLVEDHGITAKMMQMVLTAAGYTVESAGDVATALALADGYNFDLLISDLGLPDGSGHDLMRKLRARGRVFPGIALSGYGREEDIQRSLEAGFATHLTKPASREAVLNAISSIEAGKLTSSAASNSGSLKLDGFATGGNG